MRLTLTHRRATAALCAAALLFVPMACSSESSDKGTPGTTQTGSNNSKSDRGKNDAKSTKPAEKALFGYRVEGDSGTMTLRAELVGEGDLGPQPPSDGKWVLNGEPRAQLFTHWMVSGKVTFTLEGGDGAKVSIIRGTQADPDDPTSEVTVESTVTGEELAPGASVVLEFP